ncbi:zinc-ribbon domain-containing protein [Methanobrevibacter sp.]|uniref:zinc-ribbon domain-containing protein n=1 Tax=Methanobrevibacter sp. TaxID=66852 RepID=UPI00388D5393
MSKYCKSCGKEIDDDSQFCLYCGEKVDDIVKVQKHDDGSFINKLPLILAVISIIIGIVEVLSTPILMGYDSIAIAGLVAVVGGILGIYFLIKLDEPLVTAIQFIVVGALIFLFIGRFGEISTILFIITAIVTLYVEGTHIHNKKLVLIPIAIIIILFLILIIGGVAYNINAENSIAVGNITNDISYSYGYWDGHVKGDIHIDTSFDYLCVNVNFYDQNNKILDSTIGWNELNPTSGKTYTFDAMYFKDTQPAKAEIIVTDTSDSSNILYTENITLN